jgi:hypothetical protein
VTTSTHYSESGTMGSGQKIDNKTIPVDMNVDFRIPFSVFVFCVLLYVLCVCVYGIYKT